MPLEIRQEAPELSCQVNEPINCTASELSTFLQALGEGYFPTYYSDINPCVPSRSMTIASKSFPKGKRTVCFPGSRFSMTLHRLTETSGEVSSMLSAEGSPARTSALPEKATDSTENEADCGPKWPGSLARYNPGSRSWRTAQCSLLGGLTEYSGTFPRWGTMQSGELWERTMPVLRIEGKGSGYWPTPRAQEPGRTTEGYGRGLKELLEGKEQRKAPANTPSGNWPTPTCADAFTDKLKSAQQSEGSMHSVNLSQAVKMFPTPTATDYKGAYTKESMVSSGGIDRAGLLRNVGHMDNPEYKAADGGQLNPAWVCWLIGWPLGWDHMDPLNPEAFRAWLLAFQNGPTALKPSATVKSLPPPRLHGIPSTPASNKEAEAA